MEGNAIAGVLQEDRQIARIVSLKDHIASSNPRSDGERCRRGANSPRSVSPIKRQGTAAGLVNLASNVGSGPARTVREGDLRDAILVDTKNPGGQHLVDGDLIAGRSVREDQVAGRVRRKLDLRFRYSRSKRERGGARIEGAIVIIDLKMTVSGVVDERVCSAAAILVGRKSLTVEDVSPVGAIQ